jgi:hypothetical protein
LGLPVNSIDLGQCLTDQTAYKCRQAWVMETSWQSGMGCDDKSPSPVAGAFAFLVNVLGQLILVNEACKTFS